MLSKGYSFHPGFPCDNRYSQFFWFLSANDQICIYIYSFLQFQNIFLILFDLKKGKTGHVYIIYFILQLSEIKLGVKLFTKVDITSEKPKNKTRVCFFFLLGLFIKTLCSVFNPIFISTSKNKHHWLIRVIYFSIRLCSLKSLVFAPLGWYQWLSFTLFKPVVSFGLKLPSRHWTSDYYCLALICRYLIID